MLKNGEHRKCSTLWVFVGKSCFHGGGCLIGRMECPGSMERQEVDLVVVLMLFDGLAV